MKTIIAVLACASAIAGQDVVLHVTGRIESSSTSYRNFGRLPKQYRAADWTVSNESPAAVKIPLARILQEIKTDPDIAVLSRTSSISVVQDAQGRNPVETITRVGTGITGAAAGAEALKLIPSLGWGGYVVIGSGALTLALQYIFPTLRSHAVQSITGLLPETISLDPYGTQDGIVIVEAIGKRFAGPGALDVRITIPQGARP